MDYDEIAALTATARFGPKETAAGRDGLVVSSHPVVSRVGTDVLRAGGNAADAVLTAAVAQTVVEPHMSTICGCLSLLYFDASTGETTYVNGAAQAGSVPLGGLSAADVGGGRAVALPGFWAALEAALDRHGTYRRDQVVAPAAHLAREGFPVYPFLWGMLFEQVATAGRYPEGRELFFPGGRLIDVGERLRQPRLADTLDRLGVEGSDFLYRGDWAQSFASTVQQAGGVLTADDMAAYEALWMEPARGTFRGYDVVGSPPPDNGGTHLIEILNLIEQIPLAEWGPPGESADTLYWLTRFCGEVYSDGAKQGDPRHYPVPLDVITSKSYAEQRFQLMRMSDPLPAPEQSYPGSNHLTVVDREGNVATALHSVMSMPWTNGLYVDGIQVWAGGAHFARRMPRPGGRATCYVAPNMFLKDGKPVLASGSPAIGLIQNILQNSLNLLEFGLPIGESVHKPRFGGPSIATMLTGSPAYTMEADLTSEAALDKLRDRGLAIDVCNPWNVHMGSFEGVHLAEPGQWQACGDPRRAGSAQAV